MISEAALRRPVGSTLPATALRAFAIGAFSAGAVALRIVERGEPFNERTIALVAVSAFAGFVAGGLSLILANWCGRGYPAPRVALLAAAFGFCLFPAFFLGGFSLQHGGAELVYSLTNGIDAHGLRFLASRMVFEPTGYVVIFGPNYFFPWAYPAIVTAIGLAALIRR